MNPNGRPKKTEEEVLKPASFRLPPETIKLLDKAVSKAGITRSIFLRQAIEEKINNKMSIDNDKILCNLASEFSPNSEKDFTKLDYQNVYLSYLLEAFAQYQRKYKDKIKDESDIVILPKTLVSALSEELASILKPYTDYQYQIKHTQDIKEKYNVEKTYERYESDVRNMSFLNEIYEIIDDSDYWSKKRFNS